MKPLSAGAIYALKIAAFEAGQLNAEKIEMEHLFIGCLSLDKVLLRKDAEKDNGPLADIRHEWKAFATLMEICCHDPVVLRRLMRSSLRKEKRPGTSRPVHRSPKCRECFLRAEKHAGQQPVTSNDLISAILDAPGERIPLVLAEDHQCVAAIRDSDIQLPSVHGLTDAGQSADTVTESRDILARNISRYAESLDSWSEESQEYCITLRALRMTAAMLIRLCTNDGDLLRLQSALLQLLPWEGKPAGTCARIARVLQEEQKPGQPLSDAIREQIRELLEKLDREDKYREDRP
jgi:hypothetical protein